MTKFKLILTFFILFLFSFSSVDGFEMKSYRDEDLGFSINYPDSWYVKKPVFGEGVSIEQKGEEHIQLIVLVTKNVQDEGDPYETVKEVLDRKLEKKNIKPIKFWKNESGITFQYCVIYEESIPILGLSNITECSSFANNILYKVTITMSQELFNKYGESNESIVNSFEIYSLNNETIEQNNIEDTLKKANRSFYFSLIKWMVVFAVGGFIYKKIRSNKLR